MATILLVEDNTLIREALEGYLELDGHEVHAFDRVEGVVDFLEQTSVHLMVLDVMLPDGNGFLLAREIRKRWSIPLIFLTAKDAESDRILGFEMGADDYVVKPFSTRELVLRVQALLKRTKDRPEVPEEPRRWKADDHSIDLDRDSHQLWVDDAKISLTSAEWKILVSLIDHRGSVVTRQQILTDCLHYAVEGSEKTVITHMANLRDKLGQGEWIETVRGFGYRFVGRAVEETP